MAGNHGIAASQLFGHAEVGSSVLFWLVEAGWGGARVRSWMALVGKAASGGGTCTAWLEMRGCISNVPGARSMCPKW